MRTTTKPETETTIVKYLMYSKTRSNIFCLKNPLVENRSFYILSITFDFDDLSQIFYPKDQQTPPKDSDEAKQTPRDSDEAKQAPKDSDEAKQAPKDSDEATN